MDPERQRPGHRAVDLELQDDRVGRRRVLVGARQNRAVGHFRFRGRSGDGDQTIINIRRAAVIFGVKGNDVVAGRARGVISVIIKSPGLGAGLRAETAPQVVGEELVVQKDLGVDLAGREAGVGADHRREIKRRRVDGQAAGVIGQAARRGKFRPVNDGRAGIGGDIERPEEDARAAAVVIGHRQVPRRAGKRAGRHVEVDLEFCRALDLGGNSFGGGARVLDAAGLKSHRRAADEARSLDRGQHDPAFHGRGRRERGDGRRRQ